MNLIQKLSLNQRLMISFKVLFSVLCCFRYEWLSEGKQPAYRSICLSDGYGDTQAFRLLHLSSVLLQLEGHVYPLRLESTLQKINKRWLDADSCVVFDPWQFERFLLAASWSLLDGSVRRHWLRKIFPNVIEYPPVSAILYEEYSFMTY